MPSFKHCLFSLVAADGMRWDAIQPRPLYSIFCHHISVPRKLRCYFPPENYLCFTLMEKKRFECRSSVYRLFFVRLCVASNLERLSGVTTTTITTTTIIIIVVIVVIAFCLSVFMFLFLKCHHHNSHKQSQFNKLSIWCGFSWFRNIFRQRQRQWQFSSWILLSYTQLALNLWLIADKSVALTEIKSNAII